jgi:hypothetical protein
MAAKGCVIAEEMHPVVLWYPQSGVGSSDIISLKNHAHCSLIGIQGAGASACTVTVKASDDNASTTTSALAFKYYLESSSGVDQLSARTSAAAAGFTLSSGSNQFFVVEIDASDLPSGKPYVLLEVSDSGADNLFAAVAVLSGPRYAREESPSVQS